MTYNTGEIISPIADLIVKGKGWEYMMQFSIDCKKYWWSTYTKVNLKFNP